MTKDEIYLLKLETYRQALKDACDIFNKCMLNSFNHYDKEIESVKQKIKESENENKTI